MEEDNGMSIERVRTFFRNYGIEDRIQEFDTSSATVELACRSSNSVIELTVTELEKYAGPVDWVDVCKGY